MCYNLITKDYKQGLAALPVMLERGSPLLPRRKTGSSQKRSAIGLEGPQGRSCRRCGMDLSLLDVVLNICLAIAFLLLIVTFWVFFKGKH